MGSDAGGWDEKLSELRDACVASPLDPAVWLRFGKLCLGLGKSRKGVEALERALCLDEHRAEAWRAYGSALGYLGRHGEALAAYDRAVALAPDNPETNNNQGVVLESLQRKEEALAAYDRAIALREDFTEAHYNRGNLLLSLGRTEEALAAYDRAVTLHPAYAQAYNNRANALRMLGRLEEAIESYTKAAACRAGYFKALYNQATLTLAMVKIPEAIEAYDKVLALKSASAESHFGRGNALRQSLRMDEAIESYNRALALRPYYPEASWNKGLVLLQKGDYTEGWRLYEWRWKTALKEHAREFPRPLWLGSEPLQGRVLLVHTEQGFGDTLQCCRYIPMLRNLGAKVVLEAPQALVPLLADLPGLSAIVLIGEPLPDFDLHCPLMSLPLAFHTTLATIPSNVPYLSVDPKKAAAWRFVLGERTKPRVGLAWSGSSDHKNDQRRSMSPRDLRPLFALPFEFHSLHREYRKEDLAELGNLRDHHADLRNFSDTAALLSEMDLVVSVDTSVAHLAGALGKPVWILLPYVPDFRWGLHTPLTPWYPTARLYRQEAPNEWHPAVERAAEDLRKVFGLGNGGGGNILGRNG